MWRRAHDKGGDSSEQGNKKHSPVRSSDDRHCTSSEKNHCTSSEKSHCKSSEKVIVELAIKPTQYFFVGITSLITIWRMVIPDHWLTAPLSFSSDQGVSHPPYFHDCDITQIFSIVVEGFIYWHHWQQQQVACLKWSRAVLHNATLADTATGRLLQMRDLKQNGIFFGRHKLTIYSKLGFCWHENSNVEGLPKLHILVLG